MSAYGNPGTLTVTFIVENHFFLRELVRGYTKFFEVIL